MQYFYNQNKIVGSWQDSSGTKYPANWVQLATQDELNAVGVTALPDAMPQAPTPLTLEQLRINKVAEINFAFENSMAQVKNGYPQDEIETWYKQEAEARAYLADDTAETPLLDGYVAVKNVTKANLANAIIAKADMFATICGSLVGKRQYLEDVINGATLEGINSITW